MPQTDIPYILSTLTFLPLLGAIIVMCLPRPKDLPDDHGDPGSGHGDGHDDTHGEPAAHVAPKFEDPNRQLVNWVALSFAGITFLLSLLLFANFKTSLVNTAARNMQFVENADWISIGSVHIKYHMGVDGISLLLILLTTFLMTLCVVFSFNTKVRLKEFMVFLLLLETGMIGVFCALDLVLFYFFWEAMLIPMYFLIGIFGHENRVYAAIKFFLYTFAGSVLMLIAIVTLYRVTGTFDVVQLSNTHSDAGSVLQRMHSTPEGAQALIWMFGAFALAFMIKVPMFPFHTWLPDAHVEAPTAGSVILAGVMLKMGTYGFIRFCIPIFPQTAQELSWIFITLAIIGIVYGSIVAAVQPDAKKLVAYSSVAHLGFVILGIFTFTRVGLMGALVQNINHGISTPMLFFIVGMLYERRHTRQISEFGGIKKIAPMLATMLLIATLASVAVPFFNGFVGEFPILLGSWISLKTGYWATAAAATGMILSAVYMLWWFQRLMLGPVTKPANKYLPDLSKTEWLVLTPLAVVIFWFGLGSNFWTQRMDTSVNLILPPGDELINDDLPIQSKLYTDRMQSEGIFSLKSQHNFPASHPGMQIIGPDGKPFQVTPQRGIPSGSGSIMTPGGSTQTMPQNPFPTESSGPKTMPESSPSSLPANPFPATSSGPKTMPGDTPNPKPGAGPPQAQPGTPPSGRAPGDNPGGSNIILRPLDPSIQYNGSASPPGTTPPSGPAPAPGTAPPPSGQKRSPSPKARHSASLAKRLHPIRLSGSEGSK